VFQDGVKRSISTGPCALHPRSLPRQSARVSGVRRYPTSPRAHSRGRETRPVMHPLSSSPRQVPRAKLNGAALLPFGSLSAISSTFNSLSKVLFIFPSRYLFAIGLPPVFSLGWNLPPALSCNPKQLDSSRPDRTPTHETKNGAVTLHGALFQGTWVSLSGGLGSTDYNSTPPNGAPIPNVGSSRFTRRY
jgi:hypothetical protein